MKGFLLLAVAALTLSLPAQAASVERHATKLRSGRTASYITKAQYGAEQSVYVNVTVNGREASATPQGSYVQYLSRGVLVTMRASQGLGPITVRMANLRAGSVRVVVEFQT